jgi:uncharacterized delta-60 repeat protein
MKYYFLLLFFFLSYFSVLAQPGTLDPSFGSGGTAIRVVGSGGGIESDMATLSDGRIILGGTDYDIGITPFLARYSEDGALEFTYNLTGVIDEILGIAVQPDDKVVVVGNRNTVFGVARFNTDGSLDFTNTIDFDPAGGIGPRNSSANDVLIQPDGKIVIVGGYHNVGDSFNDFFAICRLTAAGAIDNTFSGDGLLTVDASLGALDEALGVAIQSDGKIIVVGKTDNGSDNDAVVMRINTNGTLDTSLLGGTGIRFFQIDTNDTANSVAIDANGNILVAGTTDDSIGDDNIFVLKLLTSGALDSGNFGPTGIRVYDFSGEDFGNEILIQPNGGIVVAGSINNFGFDEFAILKLLADGTLDTAFDADGRAQIPFSGDAVVQGIGFQPDGKIIIAGEVDDSDPDVWMARLNNDPFVTVINTNDSGYGSLRQAMINANNVTGTQLIDFKIPGSGPYNINLVNLLPPLNETTILDATTQPGWSGTNLIRINGSGVPSITKTGIQVNGQNTEIYGFEISNFTGSTASSGIEVNGDGIKIGAANKGNVINGCYNGILIVSVTGGIIQGNKIGTDRSGGTAQGNAFGIFITGNADNHLIGGTTAGTGNLISGNTGGVNEGYGIFITGGSTAINVQGNGIGLNISGTAGIPNLRDGIFITNGSNLNNIGGTGAGMGNKIAYNGNNGINITVTGSINNSIRRNSIFCNTGGGISFSTGGNNLKAAPIITTANLVSVVGTCSSCTNGETIEVYIDEDPCVAGRQAKTFLGTTTVLSGNWVLAAANYVSTLALGNRVTAIATDISGNSSLISTAFTTLSAAPTLGTTAPGSLNYNENDVASAISATGLNITDSDSPTLTQATVQISANYQNGQDVLALTLPRAGITSATFNTVTATLTIVGTGTLAQWTDALRAVTYFNSSDTPNNSIRTVTFQVSDGANLSNTVTRNINVLAINDAPSLTSSSVTGFLDYTEGSGAVVLNPDGYLIADPDNTTLTSATISITGNYQNAEDRLNLAPLPTGITSANFVFATGVLTIIGNGTLAQWQTALAQVTYQNISANPNTTARTVSIRVNDGGATNNLSNIVTHTINILPINDLPTGANEVITTDEDVDYIFAANDFTFNDTDGSFGGLQIITLPTNGSLEYQNVPVTANQLCPDVSLLRYIPAQNANGTNSASFTFKVVDDQGGASSTDYIMTVNILPINDAPTLDPISDPQPGINIKADPVVLNLTGITSGAANENQTILITATSSNPLIIPMPTSAINYISPNQTATLTYKPILAVSQTTDVTITVSVKDNGGILNGGVDEIVRTFVVPVVPEIPAPRELQATTLSQTSISLKWTQVDGNNGYEIQRASPNPFNFTTLGTVSKDVNSFIDQGLEQNTFYFYRVRVISPAGNSDWSQISGALTADVSNAPTNLTSTALEPRRVQLNWEDNSDNETNFLIERASIFSDFFYEEIAVTEANVVSFIDSNVVGNTSYYYRVRAINDRGTSAYSNETLVTTPLNPNAIQPNPPIGLKANGVSPTQIDLSWEYNINPNVYFEIYRSENDGQFNFLGSILNSPLSNSKSYIDTLGLREGFEYCYFVVAVGEGGVSQDSEIACAEASCNLSDIVIIRDDPGGQIICNGKTASLVVSQDIFQARYQWRRNGIDIIGATFRNFFAGQTGEYDCQVSVGSGACNSITLNKILVIVQGEPSPVTVAYDSTRGVLSASVRDANSYQWYKDFELIAGATSANYQTFQPGVYYVVITVAGCASTSTLFQIGEITALEDVDVSKWLNIYPNPAQNELNLDLRAGVYGEFQLNLINAQGQALILGNGEKTTPSLTHKINLNQIPQGLYILQIRGKRFVAHKKVVIKN